MRTTPRRGTSYGILDAHEKCRHGGARSPAASVNVRCVVRYAHRVRDLGSRYVRCVARVEHRTCGPVQPRPSACNHVDVSSYGLKVLDREECEALLRTQRVGRVGLCTHGPLVVPVVYAMLGADVVFRTRRARS